MKASCSRWCSQRSEMDEVHCLLRSGGPFPIRITRYYLVLPMPFGENKHFSVLRGSYKIKGPILSLRRRLLCLRGPMQDPAWPIQGLRGPSVHKVGEKDQFLHSGSGPTQPAVPSMAHFTPVSRVLAVPLLATRRATISSRK